MVFIFNKSRNYLPPHGQLPVQRLRAFRGQPGFGLGTGSFKSVATKEIQIIKKKNNFKVIKILMKIKRIVENSKNLNLDQKWKRGVMQRFALLMIKKGILYMLWSHCYFSTP